MKKRFLSLLGTSVLLVGALVPTSSVQANEDESDNEGGTLTTESTITFGAPTGPVDPVNPVNPTEPIPETTNVGIPGKSPNPPQTGSLTLDAAPHLDFGTHELSGEPKTYQSSNTTPAAQVSDRRGTGEGWNLSVELSNFKNLENQDESFTLRGSKVTLKDGEVVTTSSNQKPSINSNIELTAGGESANVLSAAAKKEDEGILSAQGVGTFLAAWLEEEEAESNSKVELYVPSGEKGSHSAKLTWVLTSGPTAATE